MKRSISLFVLFVILFSAAAYAQDADDPGMPDSLVFGSVEVEYSPGEDVVVPRQVLGRRVHDDVEAVFVERWGKVAELQQELEPGVLLAEGRDQWRHVTAAETEGGVDAQATGQDVLIRQQCAFEFAEIVQYGGASGCVQLALGSQRQAAGGPRPRQGES